MSERLPEPLPRRRTYPPVDVTPEIARKNIRLATGLAILCVLMAAGAVLISLIYLHYD
jgi:hypothetical protein